MVTSTPAIVSRARLGPTKPFGSGDNKEQGERQQRHPCLSGPTPPENPGCILRTALISVPVKCAPRRVLRRARRPVATLQSLPRHPAAAGASQEGSLVPHRGEERRENL